MGLRETITNATKSAFVAIGDIPETAYLYSAASSYSSTAYDISTGVVSVTSVSPYVISMVFTTYTNREVQNEHIEPTDLKGLVPQANVSASPLIDDWIMRVETGVSARYDVIQVEQDPAAALWKLQLRKP